MKTLQFGWLDAARSIGTARSAQVPGAASTMHQVLQRAILAEQRASVLEASLRDMTAQRDKWVLEAGYWKEQAQHAHPSPAHHRPF